MQVFTCVGACSIVERSASSGNKEVTIKTDVVEIQEAGDGSEKEDTRWKDGEDGRPQQTGETFQRKTLQVGEE